MCSVVGKFSAKSVREQNRSVTVYIFTSSLKQMIVKLVASSYWNSVRTSHSICSKVTNTTSIIDEYLSF